MRRKVAILTLLLLGLAFRAVAYDFSLRTAYGDLLFMDIVDANARQVKLVPPIPQGPDFYGNNERPNGVLVIPSTVMYEGEKYTVVAVGKRAFSGCTGIRMVTLPETVTEIGEYAFYGCTGLKEKLTIGENVRTVGISAFYGCAQLTQVHFRALDCQFMGGSLSTTVFGNCRALQHIEIGEGVRRIPDYAFCGIDALKDSVHLPQSLEYIGDYAFAFCSSMKGSVTVPNKVTYIGDCAYHQCHKIDRLTIGEQVSRIGARAFYNCIGLKTVVVNTAYPPDISMTTFGDLTPGVKFSIPCISRRLYTKNGFWNQRSPFSAHGECEMSVEALPDNSKACVVTGSNASCTLGDTVVLTAIIAAGYGFEGWSDGNMDNPRVIAPRKSMKLKAKTRPAATVTVRDTLYHIDTVYEKGFKVIHDTMDFVDATQPVGKVREVKYDSRRQRIVWNFSKKEKVFSVMLFNSVGECVYTGQNGEGNISMRRFPAGPYFIRIETMRRVIRCRFFINATH
jgi:hypothetical protein